MVVKIWNVLLVCNSVVADSINNMFNIRLDKFWEIHDIIYDFNAQLQKKQKPE